ncbi:MAG TPA: Rid family hydrolase, partial [Immundisolibacter sp.]
MHTLTVPAPPQFADKFGYSQARRVGDFIAVSGTPGRDATGEVVGPGAAYAQARQALDNVR